MTIEITAQPTSGATTDELVAMLESRTKATVAPDQDLFASGLVTSMFAMELVVHLEQTYGIAIIGDDLQLDNFRTVRKMDELVQRLGGGSGAGNRG